MSAFEQHQAKKGLIYASVLNTKMSMVSHSWAMITAFLSEANSGPIICANSDGSGVTK